MNEELKVVITAEINKFKQGVQDAKSQLTNFKQQVQNASKDVDSNMKKAGEASTKVLKAFGAITAATGAALLALGASTAEYREEQAKLTTAFESAGASADTAKKVYNDLYRVMGESDTAVEAANHLAKLTTNEKELSEWTNICQGIYATFGDSLPIEGLTEASNETAKVGTVTGTLADALNWAGVSEDEFNEKLEKCNSESERERLIRETLNGLYSEASSIYEKNNAQVIAQNEAQAKLQETTSKLGEAIAPVVTAFISFASDALSVVIPYIQQLTSNHLPKLQALLNVVAVGLQTAFKWANEHKVLLSVIGGLILTVVTAIGLYNTVAAVKAAMAALEVTSVLGLASAYAAQAAAMLIAIAPYALIVAAIAAVIAIIAVCIKNWDKICEKTKEVWNSIKQKTEETVNKVVNKFTEMKDKTINAASNIVSSVKAKFEEIKSGITEKINGAKDAVKTAIDKMKSFFNFKWELPKIKMPKISITGKFSLNPPSVPNFSISWNKLGGVFDSPTLFNYGGSLQGIGEDGAEAVVPLEKNTKWLDRLATMLSDKQGKTPIIMQVDGKTFAQISIDSINNLTKQTGKLNLKIV